MVESDGPDSVLDVASELRRFYDNCLPVGFDYVDGDRWSEGFVAHVGDDFAIFSRLQQRTWLNGYRAIRFDSIRKVGASGDAEFICRAMKARKEEIPPNIPFRPISMAKFLSVVCDHFQIAVLDDAKEYGNSSGVAGTIQNVQDGIVHLKMISPDGDWLANTHKIPVEDIEEVLFGSNYENTLKLVGELPK